MRLGLALSVTAALLCAYAAAAAEGPRARFLDRIDWSLDADWFGGLSGLELSADGREMTVIGDRGILLTARIEREGNKIARVIAGNGRRLKSSTGARLIGRIVDSEGLAIAPDGTIFVSFEGVHRVARYDTPDAAAVVLRRHQAFRRFPLNGSLEALAIDDRGRLFTLPEKGADRDGRIPVFRWDGQAWSQPFSLPARGWFRPVGADFGPDGRFYLLERSFGIFGFRSRLRRWEVTDTAMLNEETLLETARGDHDNLEGLSVWRDAQGGLRATMISDDNFRFFQRTELVEYALSD